MSVYEVKNFLRSREKKQNRLVTYGFYIKYASLSVQLAVCGIQAYEAFVV